MADGERAVELGPACGWFPYQSALTMRVTGAPGEADRWRCALELFEAQGVDGPGGTDLARSNLLVVLCALPDWGRAEEQLHRFLSHRPSRHQVAEALEDLVNLRRAVPVDAGRLAPVVGRLRDALGAM
ncbi:hypothetical protein [Streptomyces sp. NPDC029674]|uniref:hypothetical protein n=1 Tax=Streptomyces sp. NPDC029674 TaxID=3365297 RepID=UPI00384AACB7